MVRPVTPVDVAGGAAATSAWANSVTDAIQAILADIYGAVNLAIPWANLTGVPATFPATAHAHAYGTLTGIPATFAPSAHAHTAGSTAGQVAYGSLTAIPATFAPAAHGHTAGSVPGQVAYASLTGVPAAPTAASLGAPLAFDTPAVADGGKRIYVGTAAPTGMSEGDVWIKG